MSSCRWQETPSRAEELYRIVRRHRHFAQVHGAPRNRPTRRQTL